MREEKAGPDDCCMTLMRPKANIETIKHISVNNRVMRVESMFVSLAMISRSHRRTEPALRVPFS
ncbi:MAG: hypothetical protein AAFR71_05585 [Pseudomonadota bacterium]